MDERQAVSKEKQMVIDMMKYIYQDMLAVLRYLPWAVALGIPASALLLWTERRTRGDGEAARILDAVLFCIYLAVICLITLLSRESGSRTGVDLDLFSTWGINARNNAFVVENVLLFIPFGFLSCLAFRKMRHFFRCALFGGLVSLGIESLQLITGRGYFQLDDILTNILGTVLGCTVFLLIKKIRR